MTVEHLDAIGLAGLDATELRTARGLAAQLLANDGVTYTPPPGAGTPGSSRARRWRLDPLPEVVDGSEWRRLERGVVQRLELLEEVLADLYGPRRLVREGLIPAELLWRHDGYLRPAWGAQPPRTPRLLIAATDLARGPGGQWQVFGDRTQAPSGLGYAMENRRVIARVLPDVYREAGLRRLSTFFNQLRDAVVDVAPRAVEDPRVVVLTPGRHSETAFDHAFIASLLGFPLVTGSDLTTRDGRVFMRELDALRPVDVVIRRVDDTWCDPLELRPESELGVPGLLETVRRGSVVLANSFGVGVVESPALHPLLPRLAETLLDESLRVPSAEAWWCGQPGNLSHVLANLDQLVLRPLSRSGGRGAYGPTLSRDQLDDWRRRIQADPGGYVGQAVLEPATTPVVSSNGITERPMTFRTFAIARQGSYALMPGALGAVAPDPGSVPGVALSKDVWVRIESPGGADREAIAVSPEHVVARRASVAMVPRALEGLFWLGRYSERAEDEVRMVLALLALAQDFSLSLGGGSMVDTGSTGNAGSQAVDALAEALTHVTGTYPGMAGPGPRSTADLQDNLASLLLDGSRAGSIAQSLDALRGAASSVRDQLSDDVFLVLASVEGATTALSASNDRSHALRECAAQVLSGMLALAGIYAENMIRDVGWQLLDLGRALERALQTAAQLRYLFGAEHSPAVEAHLVTACLTTNESVLTHRRRYGGSQQVETMLDLLVGDRDNPRSIAFQVHRLRTALEHLPGLSRTGRLWRLGDELAEVVEAAKEHSLVVATNAPGGDETLFARTRVELDALTDQLDLRLRAISDAVADQFFAAPPAPRPLGVLRIGGAR
ncbi:MAG: circularly permuted type 2 ATP-grasp protein [Nocardioidaceae bacterium]